MRRRVSFISSNSLLAIAAIPLGGASADVHPSRVIPALVAAETSVVVPAGSRIRTRLEHRLPIATTRGGDTVYLRVALPVVIGGRIVIRTGGLIEASLIGVPHQRFSDERVGIGIRFRRILDDHGGITDVFVTGAAPNDSAYRRGVTARADGLRPSPDDALATGTTIELVADNAFSVDTHALFAGAFANEVRVVGRPPRLECYVEPTMGTMDIVIPGTPGTPAIGDVPATPGTPEIRMSGTPSVLGYWRPC